MKEINDSKLSSSSEIEEVYSSKNINLPVAVSPSDEIEIRQNWWERISVSKIALFFVSLFLFILAITLMKNGARGLTPLVRDAFAVGNPLNGLGFGWLSAYLLMSGSPVAAAALTFFDAGVLDQLSTYAMITGSRLGASFIVLLIGFLYLLRGRDRTSSLGMGLLSFSVTATTYIPAFVLGAVLLLSGRLDNIQLQSATLITSFIEGLFEPIAGLISGLLPDWGVFLVGLGIMMVSFQLFDKCLPQMTLKESHVGWMSRLVYRPVVMLGLGALVTLVSMSVSLSLSILVPLSNRGFVRRENVIPYIMGANITTFIDTLLAAVLLQNTQAFSIVFSGMLSITIISLLILVIIYKQYQIFLLRSITWIFQKNQNLIIFLLLIFIIPIILLLL